MTTEQNMTLKALQTAIHMEIDGKEYYQKLSRQISDKIGNRLLLSLAAEEDVHRQKFAEIYRTIRDKKAWPVTDFKPDGGKRLRTIFAQASEGIDSNTKASTRMLDAIQTAITMESKTYDFYKSQAGKTDYTAEKDFYNMIAAEEQQHHLILLDYHEYFRNPAGWFVKKEHPSLDGG